MAGWPRRRGPRHQPQFHIAAYPSGLVSLASDRPTTRAPSVVLVDIRPRGVGTVTADRAWMRFDVTELYRTWAEGGPFPSQGHTVEPGTPLVVDVRPDSFAEPYFEVRFAPLDRGADTAPQLRWTAARDAEPPGGSLPPRERRQHPTWGRRRRTGPLVRCRRGGGPPGGRLTRCSSCTG